MKFARFPKISWRFTWLFRIGFTYYVVQNLSLYFHKGVGRCYLKLSRRNRMYSSCSVKSDSSSSTFGSLKLILLSSFFQFLAVPVCRRSLVKPFAEVQSRSCSSQIDRLLHSTNQHGLCPVAESDQEGFGYVLK
jgi:hypothetical protein